MILWESLLRREVHPANSHWRRPSSGIPADTREPRKEHRARLEGRATRWFCYRLHRQTHSFRGCRRRTQRGSLPREVDRRGGTTFARPPEWPSHEGWRHVRTSLHWEVGIRSELGELKKMCAKLWKKPYLQALHDIVKTHLHVLTHWGMRSIKIA